MYPSLHHQIRDILILPGTATVLIPAILVYFVPEAWFPIGDAYYIKEIGGALVIGGILLGIQCIRLFHYEGHGTLAPWNAPSYLVITGPYRYVRHPMILAVLLVLVGEAFLLGRGILLLWSLLFFIGNTFWFIYREEPELLERFGAEYAEYMEHVPRWMPRLSPYKPEYKGT